MTENTWELMVSLAAILLHAAAALTVGHTLPQSLLRSVSPDSRSPSLLSSYLLGILLISLWPWIPEAGSRLLGSPWPAWVMATPLYLAAPFAPWRAIWAAISARLASLRASSARGWILLAGCGCVLAFIGGAIPPTGMDALAYHLGLPAQYLLRGSLAPISTGGYSYYFQTYEFAILPLLVIDRTGISANLLNALIFGVGATIAARIAKTLGATSGQAAAAAAAVTTSPILCSAVALTKNDLLALAFLLQASFLILKAENTSAPSRRQGGIAGLFAGAAIAVKPTTAFVVVPLLAVAAIRTRCILPFFAASLSPAPWLARNIAYAGSPLPAAFFHASAFADFSAESGTGPLGAMHHLVLSFFFRYIDGTDGPIGPALLILGVLSVVGALRDRRLRPVTLVGGLALMLWSFMGHSQARYILPAIILVAATGATLVRLDRREVCGLLFITLIGSGAYAAWRLETEHATWSWHTGRISEERYYARWLASWPLQEEGRRSLPPDARVLAVGEGELFTLGRVADWDAFWEPSRALTWAHEVGHDSRALRSRLERNGYTHILDNPEILAVLMRDQRMPPPACQADRATLDALLGSLNVVVEVPGTSARIYALSPPPSMARQEPRRARVADRRAPTPSGYPSGEPTRQIVSGGP